MFVSCFASYSYPQPMVRALQLTFIQGLANHETCEEWTCGEIKMMVNTTTMLMMTTIVIRRHHHRHRHHHQQSLSLLSMRSLSIVPFLEVRITPKTRMVSNPQTWPLLGIQPGNPPTLTLLCSCYLPLPTWLAHHRRWKSGLRGVD